MNFEIIENSLRPLSDIEGIITGAVNELIEVATERAQLEPDAPEASFDSCKEYMKGYVASLEQIQHFKAAFSEQRSKYDAEEVDVNLKENLMNLFEEKCQNKASPESHSGYKALVAAIDEVRSPNDNIPSQETVRVDDGEMILTQTITIPTDPITRQEVSDPVRNTNCHHKYDRASIVGYIQSRRGPAKCPVMGCGKPLTEQLLEVDDDVLLLLNRKRRIQNAID